MKTNFAKKIIKILTIAIFSVFVLMMFNTGIINGANFTNSSSSLNSAFMQNVSSSAENTSSEDNNPYTNPGESTTGLEQPSTDNDQNNDGTNDAFETDNPANYQTMDGEGDSSGEKFTYTLLQPLPSADGPLTKDVTIEQYLTWAFRFTLALAGFLAVMMIVIGGVEYIISGANEGMRSEAHKRISNAIYGLILALVSYLVLYTINPNLVDFKNNSFLNKETTTSSE